MLLARLRLLNAGRTILYGPLTCLDDHLRHVLHRQSDTTDSPGPRTTATRSSAVSMASLLAASTSQKSTAALKWSAANSSTSWQPLPCFRRGLIPLLHRPLHQRNVSTSSAASAPLSFNIQQQEMDRQADAEAKQHMDAELESVNTAIVANSLIFVAKVVVFVLSGSSAMLAEAVHSLVDTANQALLRVGVTKAQRAPTAIHPYGYTRDRFIWPLISAVGIFCCGAGVSFVHGVQGLWETREVTNLMYNFIVLGVSGVLESYSLWVAYRTLRSAHGKYTARRNGDGESMSFWEYVKKAGDPTSVAVFMEDAAAVSGLIIAAGCMALMQATGNTMWDAAGSIAVSLLLGGVAITLIQRNRSFLIGRSMPESERDKILAHLQNDAVIRSLFDAKTEEIGPGIYRFKAEIAFNGEMIAERCIKTLRAEELYRNLRLACLSSQPGDMDDVLKDYSRAVVMTIGREVDRIEAEIRRLNPGVRYVDLETDIGSLPGAHLGRFGSPSPGSPTGSMDGGDSPAGGSSRAGSSSELLIDPAPVTRL